MAHETVLNKIRFVPTGNFRYFTGYDPYTPGKIINNRPPPKNNNNNNNNNNKNHTPNKPKNVC